MMLVLPIAFTTNLGELSIEEFTSADVAAMAALEQSLNPSPWSEKQFHDSIDAAHWCVGVKHKNHWVAYCVISFVVGEAELLILGVDRSVQRQGIAKQLLDHLFPIISKKARSFFLEVRESNEAAIALYESLGFNQVGERANYYPIKNSSKKEAALIFAKEFLD